MVSKPEQRAETRSLPALKNKKDEGKKHKKWNQIKGGKEKKERAETK
jgi:hypothetical protein